MLRSLYTGAAGVKVHQTKMDVIGNNISNVNTTGFKTGRATFADTLSQTLMDATASTNPKQIGLGTNVASIDTIFNDGAPVVTGKNTDLALSGDGLFVVRRGNETYYTRDGAFEFDAAGNYVLPGSGHIAQGWTATDGVIDTTGAVGDIQVTKGQEMAAKATDNIDYHYNLNADTPIVTSVSGGELVTRTILVEDVSEANPLPVSFGGKTIYYVTNISDNLYDPSDWSLKEDVKLGDTSMELVNKNGDTITAKIDSGATFEVPQGQNMGLPVGFYTKNSVTEQYPLILNIDGKQYTAIGMDKNLDWREWYVKSGGANEGSNTLTITDGTDEVTFTLREPLTETLGQSAVKIEKTSSVATKANPVTIKYSDGSEVTVTEGTYQVGNSAPISTNIKVYDNLGDVHEIPVYFIREGELKDDTVNSVNKWLVSLTPDASVLKGDATSAEFVDAKGNAGTISLNVAEIQFDSSGNLVMDGESDLTGLITLNFDPASFVSDNPTTAEGENPAEQQPVQTSQNVTVDFTDLTQYVGNTTISSTGNGNLSGILTGIEIDSTGTIIGSYTNGVTRPEAQVAVAHFNNSPGLTKMGTSMYQQSDNSGIPVIDGAENLGVVITPAALEMSNVDVANEFAEMIITQRGFQSNTKVITVSDEMIETAVNMKK